MVEVVVVLVTVLVEVVVVVVDCDRLGRLLRFTLGDEGNTMVITFISWDD